MTSEEFKKKYKSSIKENPIVKCIMDKNPDFMDELVDMAWIFQEYYDQDRAYFTKAFTPHDFKHHIFNVIAIAGQLLDGKTDSFETDDLYCFLLACLLHDIAMINFSEKNRHYHSYVGAEMVGGLLTNTASSRNAAYKEMITLSNNENNKPKFDKDEQKEIKEFADIVKSQLSKLGTQQKKKIAVMVLGHSDLKLQEKTIHTLDSALYNCISIKNFTDIHALAAILRWADELDLSESRCKGIKRTELPDDSKPFWDKLMLIEAVDITAVEITLTINEEFYEKLGKQEANRLIESILAKVNKEKDTCNSVFKGHGKTGLTFPEAKLSSDQVQIAQDRMEYLLHKASTPSSEIESENDKIIPNDELHIDVLKAEIKSAIKERGLIKEGHYCLHNADEVEKEHILCIRNPLDCNGLLSSHELLDDIAEALLMEVFPDSTKSKDDYLIIGIANSGALIAAHMAIISGISFASAVPNNKRKKYTPPETNLEEIIKAYPSKKVILVIGVNYTGIAISDACKKIGNVEWVVGLMNRDMRLDSDGTNQVLDSQKIKHSFLIENDEDYRMEKCQFSTNKAECPYKKICERHPFNQEK